MLRCHETVLEHIEELSRSAHDGALLLLGEVGSGKSSILAVAHERLPDTSSLVRINSTELGWPLSGVSALLSAIGDARVAEFAGRFVLRSEDPAHLAEAAGELLAVLRGLNLPRTLLLVDDIDRMDPFSRHLIGYMASHLAGSGLRIAASAVEIPPDEPLAGIRMLGVPPLDDRCAEQLVPAGVDPGTLRLLTASAGGNLGTLVSLVAGATAAQLDGREALRLPAPPGPAAWAVFERIGRNLGSHQALVLDRLAAAPLHHRSSVAAWSSDAEDALEELLDAGIARELGAFVMLSDPLLRSAISAALPARARRTLHVELWVSSGVLLRPWHASGADPAADFRGPLLSAAAELASLGFPSAAVEFADRAARLGRAGTAGPLATVADRLLLAGEPELAERCVRIAAAAQPVEPDAHVALAVSRLRIDHVTGRNSMLPELDPELARRADPEVRMRWTATLAAITAARGEFASARLPLAELTAELPTASDATKSIVAAALALTESEGGDPLSLPAPPSDEFDPLLLALHARADILAQDYPRARGLIQRLGGSLVRPSGMWAGWLTSLGIDCEVRAGRYGEALEYARGWALHHPGADGPAGFVPLRVWAAIADGDLASAQEQLAAWSENAAARVGPLPAASGLVLLAELASLRDDVERACELLLLADAISSSIDDPALTRHLAELTEALVATGRVRAAERTAGRLAEAAGRHPSRWSTLASARAAVACAPAERLPAAFLAARTLHAADDSLFELGKLHAAHARRLDAAGLHADAERAWTDARIAFAGSGARPWMRRATPASAAQAAATDTAPSLSAHLPLHELSTDERAVADLVVRGMQNKEIAAQLFVSVRTVELRLTHIYRKVGARSRSHLVALMS
ncbi:LuxR C-terminal-related transcriptional regulator [Protaetiibacter larvae]|uniref:HTH luxR-type domain-containing protein n=1 Tax=Protaetiibacter larvae TaxID=2592654 RepID=A0A5C1Y8E2_9MICO|nr:LuxR C-terminal-related transcriptional regulator [Protaetiibacter larvae]QEO09439.1 hypothetical protein FLP23_05100 [Protaetiibacter larvae]